MTSRTGAVAILAPRCMGFPPAARLLAKADFDRVFNQATCKVHQPGFLLLGTAGSGQRMRLGLVVGRKHAKRAHERNRIKRLSREAFRQMQWPAQLPLLDIVLVAKPAARTLDNAALTSQLQAGWQQLIRRWRHASQTSVAPAVAQSDAVQNNGEQMAASLSSS